MREQRKKQKILIILPRRITYISYVHVAHIHESVVRKNRTMADKTKSKKKKILYVSIRK